MLLFTGGMLLLNEDILLLTEYMLLLTGDYAIAYWRQGPMLSVIADHKSPVSTKRKVIQDCDEP